MITTRALDDRVLLMDGGKALLTVKKENIISFDDSVTAIGPSFMEGDASIEGVILSDTVEEVEDNAFLRCDNLKFVVLGKNLRTICQCAFTGNRSLRYVIYNGTKKEYLQIAQGAPFENIEVIHCTDGTVKTVQNTN